MGKLDVTHFRYLKKTHFRVLTSIENGMKNHEYVPDLLIHAISKVNKHQCTRLLGDLIKLKMVQYLKNKDEDGYRLTYYGYDILSLNALTKMNMVSELGSKVGVGKESDIYVGRNDTGERIILKFHRLGRNSFRKIKEKRDYHEHRSHVSWLYASRIAASKEFEFMKKLKDHDFLVPEPIAHNRHCVVMSLIDGFTLSNIIELDDPTKYFDYCRDTLIKMAEHGLVHCDFNEFNLMIDSSKQLYMIDFPQMISIDHKNAEFYFTRDYECVKSFFEKRFNLPVIDNLNLSDITRTHFLDLDVRASGYIRKNKAYTEKIDNSSEDCVQEDVTPQDIEEDIDYIGDAIDDFTITEDTEETVNTKEFSMDYIKDRVKANLTNEDRKVVCARAVKNSKKSISFANSKSVRSDIKDDVD